MNELQVKTIKLTPAVIEFNHIDLEKELQKNLAKYEGLTFTSEATSEIRSTLAKLRKGKRAVDDYRKEVENELKEPVEIFKGKCKELDAYFDNVINPLEDQLKIYVEQERAEKLQKLEVIRDEHIDNHELSSEYVDRVEIENRFLNKSVSLKEAGESIEFQVKNLKMEQEKVEADKAIVATNVKLANAENEMSLSEDAYLRLLEFEDVSAVMAQLNNHVEAELSRREEEKRKEELRIEQEKIEQERNEQEKKDANVTENVAEVIELNPFEEVVQPEVKVVEKVEEIPFSEVDEVVYMDDPFASEPMEVKRFYEIYATEEQLEKIESFMSNNDIDWKCK